MKAGRDMASFSQRLELRQSQRLTVTPQMRQVIRMLQLSNLELTDFIEEEIKQNPLLEWHEASLGEHASRGKGEVPAALSGVFTGRLAPDAVEHWQAEWGEDGDRPVDLGGEPQPWHSRNGSFDVEGRSGLDQTATRLRTLREHLLEQIGVDLVDQGDRLIALHLLELLDEDGYLRAPLDGVAQQLGCGVDRVEGVLARLQEFDPAGIFARDLKECLVLQLRDRNRLDPAMQALLDNLELLAYGSADDDDLALVRLCGVDAADMADMIREIQSLDPKPGHTFDPQSHRRWSLIF